MGVFVCVCAPVPEPIYYRQESEQSEQQARKQENLYVKNFWLNKSFPLLFASQNNSQQDRVKDRERKRERRKERRSRKSQRHMANKKSKPRKGKSFRSSTMRAARIETETGTESVLPKLQKPNQKLVNFCISINFSCSFCPLPSYHIPPFPPLLLLCLLFHLPHELLMLICGAFVKRQHLQLVTSNPSATPLPAIRKPYRVSVCHIIFMKVAQTNSPFHCSRFHCSLPSRISWKETVTWSFGSL